MIRGGAAEPAADSAGTSHLRIVHAVLSGGFYGSERYCIDLAIAQARAGHHVAVMAESEGTDCVRGFRASIVQAERAAALLGSLKLTVFPRALPTWLQRPAAWRMLRRLRPDIVHTHLNPAARRIGRVAQSLGIPHVSTLLIHYNEREHAPCDGLIALTRAQLKLIPERHHHKVAVVWLGLPATVEDAIARVSGARLDALRRQWRAGETDVVFGSVGRLTPVKGMDVLIGAFKTAFADGGAGARLVLVGEGEDRANLERLAAGDERIIFAGHQGEIAPFYRAFDVFVSSARFEPFGIAVVEAMAAGCRLVVTRTDGPAEFLTDPCVLWATPGREDELAVQLRAAAARQRERLSYDLSRLKIGHLAQEIEAFYRRILRAPGQAAG
jgi:glycosyltransferase involved in cell wall biosynthesis